MSGYPFDKIDELKKALEVRPEINFKTNYVSETDVNKIKDTYNKLIETVATLALNIIFLTIKDQKSITFIGNPFYFIGNEHDGKPSIISK